MSTNKQSGFGIAIVIIIAVVVLAIIGYAGYRVYTANTNKPASTSNTTTNNQTANNTQNSNNQTGNTQNVATYLDIKELGIKIKLSNSIKDAIYVAGTGSDGSQFAHISTQTLSDKSSGTCGLNGTPIASITKVSSTNITVNNTSVFKLGNNYFVMVGPQATCSNDQTIQDLADQQRITFANDFKTVQLDN